MYYRNSYTTDSKIRVAVGFGARPKRFGSRCFVCQTKKLNSRRHIPERLIGQRLAKSSKGVLCQPKWRNLFRRLKSIAVCTFGYSLLALNSDHFDAWTTKLQPVAKVLETLYRILAWMACPWSCACDPPPPLIKVASNTRPYSKLGGTTLNGREEGGQYYILQTCDQERFEARKVVFPWECLIIFATGCLSTSYPYSRGARLSNGVKRGALLAPKEVVIKVSHFPTFACSKMARQKRQFLALLFIW